MLSEKQLADWASELEARSCDLGVQIDDQLQALAETLEQRAHIMALLKQYPNGMQDAQEKVQQVRELLGTLQETAPKNTTAQEPGDVIDRVVQLLAEEGPLHYRDVYKRLTQRGVVASPGAQDPASALLARYYNEPRLVRIKRGTYKVRTAEDSTQARTNAKKRSRGQLGFRNTRVRAFGFRDRRVQVSRFNEVLAQLLDVLYEAHEAEFDRVLSLRGSRRKYFATAPGELTRPRRIDDSRFYVEMNFSADDSIRRCHEVLELFGYDPDNDFNVETESR